MFRRLRSYVRQHHLAMVALFVALGPAAYATHHAVNSANIINGQVKNEDLASNAVGTGKVADGSLLRQDFKAGQLPRGAIQFNVHVDGGDEQLLAKVNGINVLGFCAWGPEGFEGPQITFQYNVALNGIKTSDGVLSSVHTGGSSVTFSGGRRTQDFDGLVRGAAGKWTHFDVGSYGERSCNFWGLVIRPSK